MGLLRVFIMVTLLFLGPAESRTQIASFDSRVAIAEVEEQPVTSQEKVWCADDARDIVLLIDGSSSMRPLEFTFLMVSLVRTMISFPDNTLFSLLQYSDHFKEHFSFRHYFRNRSPGYLLAEVSQLGGTTTHTASGIRKAVRELFAVSKGARNTARKILVIVTDGEKTGDPLQYAEVVEEADRAGVTRFAVGIGWAFSNTTAQQELHAMASQPATEHVIEVRDVTNPWDMMETQLKKKICGSHGIPTTTPPSPVTCPSHSDHQIMLKLERVMSSLDEIRSKLDLVAAREGKCGHVSSHQEA